MNNYLSHHGVKGQQWGVKHGPPYPIDKSKGDITLRAGTKINRVAVRDESQSKGHAYVTYRKDDTQHYRGAFAKLSSHRNANGKNPYAVTMTTKKDLKGPSEQKRRDTFREMYKTDPQIAKELGSYYKRDFHNFTPGPERWYQYKFSKLTEKKLDDVGYKTFAYSLGDADHPYIRDHYFDKLSNLGYDFVTDDMDAKRGFGNEPTIIFDRQKSTNYINQRELSRKEMNEIAKKEGLYIRKKKEREW